MIRLILYLILGYIIWRVVQIVMRMAGRSSRSDSGSMEPPAPHGKSPSSPGFTDVKDARFEDIPRSKPKGDESAPSN